MHFPRKRAFVERAERAEEERRRSGFEGNITLEDLGYSGLFMATVTS
jgi:hypothetical protein